ncbi:substrate-binding periplasmic protein [Simiduia agarivorans]|uniref:ABC transporter substrate-binding protein n=1 Tax=Simiduia agarivorans (strain DSM 21679 / JCM 13881 / BCRC 17597 / SA1) TaxID=1117647 RepID=K4L0V0_SIMAS|nr:transporter substrate-binding domain-containing protein [Simiduia agarivorans]AFU99787.1 ABC transporter substrate-binding protein [Simiduia agarivorans SA1 = DSM 21679]
MKRFLTAIALAACVSVQAQDAAQFSAPRVPVHLEADHSGFLVELHQWLMQRAGIDAGLTVVPIQRATHLLETGAVDGLYPSWVPAKYHANVLFSSPLMQIDHYLFSAPGKPVYSSLAQMSGKRLGVVQGYEIGLDYTVPDLWVAYAANSEALVTMLLSGRIDAMLLSLNEVKLLQLQQAAPAFGYDSKATLARRYLGYCILNNEKGLQLQRKINHAIYAGQRSGELYQRFPQLTPIDAIKRDTGS